MVYFLPLFGLHKNSIFSLLIPIPNSYADPGDFIDVFVGEDSGESGFPFLFAFENQKVYHFRKSL